MTQTLDELVPASHLRTVHTPRSVIVVDYLDGGVSLLTGPARDAWLGCLRGTAMLRDDPHLLSWTQRGWLIPGTTNAAVHRAVQASDPDASWGTQEVLAYLPPSAPSPWRWRLAALPALVVVLVVKHHGHPAGCFHRLIRVCRIGARLPLASADQTRHAVRAVRWAARLIPARVACLEESVAAVLLLADAGKRGRWRHGIATDPIRLHAWLVDPDGAPVEEPAETTRYTTISELP